MTTARAQIHGDAWLVGELIRNLLSNAIQHTPPGDKLGIPSSQRRRLRRRRLEPRRRGWRPGLDHLFEPFSSSCFSNRGSGLGLAICQEIVTSLGGQISLANRRENGVVVGLDAQVVFTTI